MAQGGNITVGAQGLWPLRGFLRRPISFLLLTLTLLAGCADNPPAPIEDRNAPSARSVKTQPDTPDYGPSLVKGKPYTVRKGDSLYAIAFRLGMDFERLARHNNIAAPYTIFPGQVLKTDIGTTVAKRKTKTETASTKRAKSSAGSTTKTPSSSGTQSAPTKSVPAPSATAKAPSGSSSGNTSSASANTAPKAASSTASAANLGPVSRWLWPSSGTVQRSYSTTLHKGVDIGGKRGDPVKATAPGVVVYSGTGVKGYGALLIVKHNEQFLSAYGHNDAILVNEGDLVSAGQQIARMGSSGTDSVKLHFEIRRQGQPVDPLKLLPRR